MVECDFCSTSNFAQSRFCSGCGRSLQGAAVLPTNSSATGRLPAQSLLKQQYLIVKTVGQGGMGAVYQAIDQQFGKRPVAIKELSVSNLTTPREVQEATSLFEQEGNLLANLMHPSLPHIYDYFSERGRWYLVMDFIAGETLESYLRTKGGKLSALETLDIGIKLCPVLNYLHTRQPPIIFRDLKPANIMLGNNGIIYLIDFGIARLFKPGQSQDTTAFGSIGYAPPEQHGKARTTPGADIYSLGATLHQLLSGNDPTNAPFRFAPLQWQGRPGLAELETLITQMLDMAVTNRPASMAEVQQRLQDIAVQLTNPRKAQVFANAIVTPVSGQQHQKVPPPPVQPVAIRNSPLQTKKVVSPPSIGTVISTYSGHSDGVRAVALSPDGQQAVSASDDVQIWNSTTAQKLFTYANPSLLVYGLAWSPDDWYIASGHFDRTVQVWDTSTGNVLATYRNHTDRVRAVAWAYDSKSVASSGDDNTVCIWSANSGNNPIIYRGHKDSVFALAWSPDGKQIVSASDDTTVQVWNAITGTLITTYRGHKGFVRTVAWSPDSKFIASGSWDQTVHIWNPTNGQHIYTYRGHEKMVNAVAWFPDSRRIASGSRDKQVHIWDSSSPKAIFTYCGHTETINALACSSDGQRIVSASEDKTVQMWQAQ